MAASREGLSAYLDFLMAAITPKGISAHIGSICIHKNASQPLGSPVIAKTFIVA